MTRAVPFCRSVERRHLIIKGHLILIEAKKKKDQPMFFSKCVAVEYVNVITMSN